MKSVFKMVACGIALILVAPLALVERVARSLAGRDVFFPGQAELLSLFPGKAGSYLRNAYYYLTLRRCPLDCYFGLGSVFAHSDAEVGHRVYVGLYCVMGRVTIGDETMLSDHVQVLSGRHQHGLSVGEQSFQAQLSEVKSVSIGHNCWLGSSCVVMADVGENSIIGAGSVVTAGIAPNSVAVGAPARVVRETVRPS